MSQTITAPKLMIITLAVLVIALALNTGYLNLKITPTPNTTAELLTINETPKTVSSAEELKSLFTRDLFKYGGYTETLSYEETPDLIDLATVNAKNGTNSIRLAGDNAKDAYYAYTLYSSNNQNGGYYFTSEDKLKVASALRENWNSPGSYGLAVYQDGNHYNVSAVLRSHHPDESVKDKDGAYAVRKVPDTISYLWADTVG